MIFGRICIEKAPRERESGPIVKRMLTITAAPGSQKRHPPLPRPMPKFARGFEGAGTCAIAERPLVLADRGIRETAVISVELRRFPYLSAIFSLDTLRAHPISASSLPLSLSLSASSRTARSRGDRSAAK